MAVQRFLHCLWYDWPGVWVLPPCHMGGGPGLGLCHAHHSYLLLSAQWLCDSYNPVQRQQQTPLQGEDGHDHGEILPPDISSVPAQVHLAVVLAITLLS